MANSKNLVAWNSVFTKLALAPAPMTKELGAKLTEDLADWLQVQATKGAAEAPAFSEKECKEYATLIHKTFNDYKVESVELSVLAAFYSVKNGGEIEDIKGIVKGVAKMIPDTFSIGAGAAPKVRRLKTVSGKATGQEAFDNTRKAPASGNRSKGLLRKTKSTVEAFKASGVEMTDANFGAWVKHCDKHDVAEPTAEQLKEFLVPAPAASNGAVAATA